MKTTLCLVLLISLIGCADKNITNEYTRQKDETPTKELKLPSSAAFVFSTEVNIPAYATKAYWLNPSATNKKIKECRLNLDRNNFDIQIPKGEEFKVKAVRYSVRNKNIEFSKLPNGEYEYTLTGEVDYSVELEENAFGLSTVSCLIDKGTELLKNKKNSYELFVNLINDEKVEFTSKNLVFNYN